MTLCSLSDRMLTTCSFLLLQVSQGSLMVFDEYVVNVKIFALLRMRLVILKDAGCTHANERATVRRNGTAWRRVSVVPFQHALPSDELKLSISESQQQFRLLLATACRAEKR
jgi:hypothetical protein